jgi:hypothetical protein
VVSEPATKRFGVCRPMVPRLAAPWPHQGPDLAREIGDRGLAVGAGDGGDGGRLRAVKARRDLRQALARIVVGDQRQRRLGASDRDVGDAGAGRREDRGGAAVQRLVDVASAIGTRAGQGGEQVTRAHLARVRRDADNVDLRGLLYCNQSRSLTVQKFIETQPRALVRES